MREIYQRATRQLARGCNLVGIFLKGGTTTNLWTVPLPFLPLLLLLVQSRHALLTRLIITGALSYGGERVEMT
jgi:hypothetical protein